MSVGFDPSGSVRAAPAATALQSSGRDAELRAAATRLEAAFLAEMLKQAGFDGGRQGLGGGGPGEAQFASFLRVEHARLMAERGGIGLAEHLFRALAAREAPPASPPGPERGA